LHDVCIVFSENAFLKLTLNNGIKVFLKSSSI